MNELTIEGFVFYLFWGSVLMLALGFSMWVWETVADARHRKRFWRAMEKGTGIGLTETGTTRDLCLRAGTRLGHVMFRSGRQPTTRKVTHHE